MQQTLQEAALGHTEWGSRTTVGLLATPMTAQRSSRFLQKGLPSLGLGSNTVASSITVLGCSSISLPHALSSCLYEFYYTVKYQQDLLNIIFFIKQKYISIQANVLQ